MKFRLFHLFFLEICKCHHHILSMTFVGTYWFRISSLKVSRNPLVLFHIGSIFHFRLNLHALWQIVGDSGFLNVCDMCSVSVAINFVHPQTGSDYGYHRLVSWLASPTAFSRTLGKGFRCLLWNNGNNMCWQITLSFLQFPRKSFCLGRGC